MPPLPIASPSANVRHVFVYGTLRRGEQRDINLLRPAPVWVGRGSVGGLLYDLGSYPGLVTAEGAERVQGEVYAISAVLEQQLDEIEEVWPQRTGEYAKVELAVLLDEVRGASTPALTRESPVFVQCLVYELATARLPGMHLIKGGDWVAYRLDSKS